MKRYKCPRCNRKYSRSGRCICPAEPKLVLNKSVITLQMLLIVAGTALLLAFITVVIPHINREDPELFTYPESTRHLNTTLLTLATTTATTTETTKETTTALTNISSTENTTIKPQNVVPAKYIGSSSSGSLSWEEYQEAYAIAADLVSQYQGMDRASQVKGVAYELYYYGVQRTGYLYDSYPKHYADPYGFFVVRVASSAGAARAAGLCFDILGIPWEHFQKNSTNGEQGATVRVGNEEWLIWAFREPQPFIATEGGYSLVY